jgi:release factor H-coupled RctB family protein
MNSEKITVISSHKSWIEGAALAQLEKVAELPGVEHVFGMPGVHPGPGHPVDAVFTVRDRIYPHLVGSDVGCGMQWWRLASAPTRPERWAKKIRSMERGITNPEEWLQRQGVEPCGFEHSLGTVGRGNHFSEFLVPDKILDPQTYAQVTHEAPALLLVHSGSRGYGEKILYEHTEQYRDAGLAAHSEEAAEYLAKHDHAMAWAKANRSAIAERLFDMIGITGEFLSDIPHNFVEGWPTQFNPLMLWTHRKGAIPANKGTVIIPGSRGAHSYLVEPKLETCAKVGYSLSHGAGRKMSRRDARIKFNAERDSIQRLQRTKFGSIVICEDREMLMEEAPEAYKPIDRVIQDLVDHDLVRVIAMLKPVITYKYRRGNDDDGC